MKPVMSAVLLLAVLTSAVADDETPRSSNRPSGYIPPAQVLDSAAFLPPPPGPGSASMQWDEEAAAAQLRLQGDARWELASRDTDLSFPAAADLFSCALGLALDEAHTPHTYRLLQRSLVDFARATGPAKDAYRRSRPFVVNGGPTCTPDDEASLREAASYPSGHAAVGWGWALILSSLAPERAGALLARGLAFGESRAVCNLHWHSDVEASRPVASAVLAQLLGRPEFLDTLAEARKEIARARQQGSTPNRDCPAEARALSTRG